MTEEEESRACSSASSLSILASRRGRDRQVIASRAGYEDNLFRALNCALASRREREEEEEDAESLGLRFCSFCGPPCRASLVRKLEEDGFAGLAGNTPRGELEEGNGLETLEF